MVDVQNGTVQHRISAEGADPLLLAGVNDNHLLELSRVCGCRVILRDDQMVLSGALPDVERIVPVAQIAQGNRERDCFVRIDEFVPGRNIAVPGLFQQFTAHGLFVADEQVERQRSYPEPKQAHRQVSSRGTQQ